MNISGLLVFNSDNMRAECRLYPSWTGVKISDESSFDVEFHFDKPGHARKAQLLADAINAAMRDPAAPVTDDLRQWENLLACWQSGQISASQWLAHCEDPAFAAWVSATLDTK